MDMCYLACAYRTPSGYCGSAGGAATCPHRQKKHTNADRIRAMNDEELATVIALPYIASPPWCAEHRTCPYINEDPTPCNKCALDWLKEEAGTDAESV